MWNLISLFVKHTKTVDKPNIMYQTDHPAYKKLQEIGAEITGQVNRRAVVVFSAHWQAGPDKIEVNTAEKTDLIYEYVEDTRVHFSHNETDATGSGSFYGFPQNYYKERYPHVGSKAVAEEVMSLLRGAGIEVEGVQRGLDHGVWASFKCGICTLRCCR